MADSAKRRGLLAVVAAGALACATPQGAGSGAPAQQAAAQGGASSSGLAAKPPDGACGPRIDGLTVGFTRAVSSGSVLLLGELQGTVEGPDFAGRTVCHLLSEGMSVVLALELPLREQPALERYLASEGTNADFTALTSGPFWHRQEQDGRSSQAVADLIERVRALRRAGKPVSLLAFDVEGRQGSERDQAMAGVLLARKKAEPKANLVVLTGNVHASTEPGVSWDEEFRPMAWHLAKAGAKVRTFDMMHQGGNAWGCRLGERGRLACGPYRAARIVTPGYSIDSPTRFAVGRGRPPPQLQQLVRAWTLAVNRNGEEGSFFLHMAPNRFPRGFDGYFYVQQLTASAPARGTPAM